MQPKLQKLGHTQFLRFICLQYQASFWPDNSRKWGTMSSIVGLTTHSSLLPSAFAITSNSSTRKHEKKNRIIAAPVQTGHIKCGAKWRPGNPHDAIKIRPFFSPKRRVIWLVFSLTLPVEKNRHGRCARTSTFFDNGADNVKDWREE